MQCRLCASCWNYWKKYGGLKTPTHLDGTARASSVSRAILPLHSGPDSETLKIKCFTKHGIYHLGIKPISCSLPPIYLTKLNQNSDLSWSSLSLLHDMWNYYHCFLLPTSKKKKPHQLLGSDFCLWKGVFSSPLFLIRTWESFFSPFKSAFTVLMHSTLILVTPVDGSGSFTLHWPARHSAFLGNTIEPVYYYCRCWW